MSVSNNTTSLSNTVATWYYKIFLERARAMLVHQEGAQFQGIDGNMGDVVKFNRYVPRALVTTPISPEGSAPSFGTLSTQTVNVQLAEYEDSVQVTRLLSTTDIDERDAEKIDVMAQGMGESLDAITRNALFNGGTALSTFTPGSGILTPALVAQVKGQLTHNKALAYPGTFPWLGKIQPETEYDISQSTAWQNAAVYSNVQSLYEGEIGALYGSRFLTSNQGYIITGTPNQYANIFHGREAFGVYDNKLDPPNLYIVTGADSYNPTERWHTLSWAGQFVAQVLNAAWVLLVETTASLQFS
jgi:N4-gp56 family major capsid protein